MVGNRANGRSWVPLEDDSEFFKGSKKPKILCQIMCAILSVYFIFKAYIIAQLMFLSSLCVVSF